jgi:hypothetical protein
MSVASDWVSTYRQQLGILIRTRETLRSLHRIITTNSALLDEDAAFAGTNSDLDKTKVLAAKAVLDALDANEGLSQGEVYLQEVAGTNALPRV